jgi:RNA polymerase sigma-70 factor (ECF subfamily)
MDGSNARVGIGERARTPTRFDSETRIVSAAVAAAQRGEGDGVRSLYVRFADDVYSVVKGILRDEHEAEDVTQHVFAMLPKRIKKYEPRGVPFKAWLLRVARNAAVDSLRSRRSVPVEEVRTEQQAQPEEDRHLREALESAFSELPADQREVVVLRHLVGLSPGEIAERLGKSEGAVHGLHHRGRRAIKAQLAELGAAPFTA